MKDEEIGNDEDMGQEMDDDQEPQKDPMTCLIAFKKKRSLMYLITMTLARKEAVKWRLWTSLTCCLCSMQKELILNKLIKI